MFKKTNPREWDDWEQFSARVPNWLKDVLTAVFNFPNEEDSVLTVDGLLNLKAEHVWVWGNFTAN